MILNKRSSFSYCLLFTASSKKNHTKWWQRIVIIYFLHLLLFWCNINFPLVWRSTRRSFSSSRFVFNLLWSYFLCYTYTKILTFFKTYFFQEVIWHQFLKRNNRALMSKNVKAIFPLINLAQKVPFLEDLKKKVSKSDWNQRHIVYVTQIHYYTWF